MNFGFNPQPPQQNQPQINIIPQNQSQNQRNPEEEYKNLSSRINNQLKSFEFENPKGLIKQSLKNTLGLNFSNFNNNYSRNIHNFGVDKIYILSHNLRSNLELPMESEIDTKTIMHTCLGTPPQCFDLIIQTNSFYIMVPDNQASCEFPSMTRWNYYHRSDRQMNVTKDSHFLIREPSL